MTNAAAAPDRDADGRFATVATETHFNGPIFSVRTDTVTMPGGGTAKRDVVDHLAAVGVVALDDDDRVVMIEQYRHPLRRRLWEVPAGLMDIDGEPALVCAQRELREEVSQEAENWSVLVDLAVSPGYCTEAIRVFLATGLRHVDAPPRADEEADLTVVWVPLAEAVAAVLDGRVVNATAVAGLLAASAARAAAPARAPRPADDDFARSVATVNRSAEIGTAPRIDGASIDIGSVIDWDQAAERQAADAAGAAR